jgi:hypothetical protein
VVIFLSYVFFRVVGLHCCAFSLQLTTGLDGETQGDKQPEIIVGIALIYAPLSLSLFCYFGSHHAVIK